MPSKRRSIITTPHNTRESDLGGARSKDGCSGGVSPSPRPFRLIDGNAYFTFARATPGRRVLL